MAEDQSDDSEKTEEPTAQRREDFRNKGQVAQTKELATVLMLFGATLLMWLLGKYFFSQVHDMFTHLFQDSIVTAARGGDYYPAMIFVIQKASLLVLPVLALIFIIGIASSLIQIGFLTTSETLKPSLNKINPLNGLKRMFSLQSVNEGLKSIFKMLVIGFIVYMILKSELPKAPFLIHFSIQDLITYFGDVSFRIVFGAALGMTFLAIMDYGFQRWDLEKKMMMSKQEIKEEVKSREGDPQIKARIRRIQRELANKRMMQQVPKADVIITNPTHIAVALKYDATLPAPQLIAKGADRVAEKIRELAKENNIPIVENKPLARTIFKTMKLGQLIPRELFNAVAEVLAYVYKLKRKLKGRR